MNRNVEERPAASASQGNGSWEANYELGCKHFLAKQWQQAKDYFIRAVKQDNKRPEGWLALSLASAKLGHIHDAVNQIYTCVDMQPDNCVVRFCADVFNHSLLDDFYLKTGNRLTLYDDEVVYTTEDEIDIMRGTELDSSKFQNELEVFWKGFVMGRWEEVKSKYGYSDEWVSQTIFNIKEAIGINFNGIEISSQDRILEIGSGSGRTLHVLACARLINNIVASDVAVRELQGLRDHLRQVYESGPMGYIGLLADQLPFKKNSFDVILIMDVVEHLYHHEFVGMLRSLREVLKPSGKIYIETPNALRYMGGVRRFEDGTVNIPEMNGNWQHVAEKTMGYLKKTLNECGYHAAVMNREKCVVKATHGSHRQ